MYSSENHKIGVKIIAEELEVPQPFLAKLLQQLNRSEFVNSAKGPSGGFYLSEANKQKTVWDIVLEVDGSEKFSQCFMGLSRCGDENPCPVHFTVAAFKNKIYKDFKDKTIADFIVDIQKNGRFISLKALDVFPTVK